MNKEFYNTLFFIIILCLLVCLFYYTKITKEQFFDNSSDLLPPGLTFVILDGKAPNDNGWNVYSNQTSDTCIGDCSNYLVNSTNTCSVNTQPDGNIVIKNSNGAVWSTNTTGQGTPPYSSSIGQDGNFVLYDSSKQAIWSTNLTGTTPPYRLRIQPNCNLVVYDNNFSVLWQSGTWQDSAGSIVSPKKDIDWLQIPGSLMSVAITADGNIFATDSQFKILYKTQADFEFKTIPGSLKTIDTDSTYVCGITNQNTISCATINDAINGNWKTIGSNGKSVSVSNNSVYAVNLDNSLSYSSNISNLNNVVWSSIPITRIQFHSISLDNGVVVGINSKNELMYADQNIFSINPNFTNITVRDDMKNLINISIYRGSILVTDIDGNLWYTPDYKNTQWSKIKTKGKTFMAVVVQQNSIEPKKVFGNNGSVSCDTFCSGINGQPWGGELPVEWNGAKCVGVGPGITDCNSKFTATPDTFCLCAPTDNGWRN
jgi:hypothetical protein